MWKRTKWGQPPPSGHVKAPPTQSKSPRYKNMAQTRTIVNIGSMRLVIRLQETRLVGPDIYTLDGFDFSSLGIVLYREFFVKWLLHCSRFLLQRREVTSYRELARRLFEVVCGSRPQARAFSSKRKEDIRGQE